jgi:hypothetical protein
MPAKRLGFFYDMACTSYYSGAPDRNAREEAWFLRQSAGDGTYARVTYVAMPAKRLYIFKTNSPDGYNAILSKRLCIFDDTAYKPL